METALPEYPASFSFLSFSESGAIQFFRLADFSGDLRDLRDSFSGPVHLANHGGA
jgi:hypothetical protein